MPPLNEKYGLSSTQTQVIFGLTFLVFTSLSAVSGRLQDKFGPRLVSFAGGIFFTAGYLVSSYSGGNFGLMLFGYAILGGAGIGFCYICAIAASVKWFPERKGLATGIVVAAYGGGAVLLSSVVEPMFAFGYDVLEVFRIIGITYGSAVILASLLLFTPQKDSSEKYIRKIPTKELLRDAGFLKLAFGMFCGTFAGMMIAGNIKPIGLSYGVGPLASAIAISAFAAGNAAGRMVWGYIFDKIGHRTIPIALLLSSLAVAALIPAGKSSVAFVAVAAVVAFAYGANFVLYAAEVAHRYGSHSVGRIYSTILIFYGCAGLAGPALGGWLYDQVHSHNLSILIASAVTALGIPITFNLNVAPAEIPEKEEPLVA